MSAQPLLYSVLCYAYFPRLIIIFKNPEDADSPTPGVTISQSEYDGLNKIAAQYSTSGSGLELASHQLEVLEL